MSIENILRIIDSLTKLLGVVIWPAVALFALVRFGTAIRDFISNMAQFTFKGGGIEASATRQKAEATAALVAASVKDTEANAAPEIAARNARAAAEVVAAVATPRVIRRAGRSTVLWVDDRPSNNINERQALQALGVSFVMALSTDEAMEKIKRQEFDAIISDMGRPPDPRAGYTLLDKLRTSGNQTPFIIYAGSRSIEHQAEARQRGAVGCTNRPDELFEMVISVLGR